MRFAIDTVDETGNNRIYIGTPLGMAEDQLCVQLRDGQMKIAIDKIVDYSFVDAAAKLLPPFVLENKTSKLDGCK